MKKRKAKASIVQSTLRLPRPLWVRINRIATQRNLSMQQAVQQAITEYCEMNTVVKAFGRTPDPQVVHVRVTKGGKS